MSLMDLLTRHKATEAEKRERRFRQLLDKAIAKKSALSVDEIVELENLNSDLGHLDLDQTVALFERHREYSDTIADRKRRQGAKDDAAAKWHDHDAETRRIQAEYEATMRSRAETGKLLQGAATAATEALDAVALAEDCRRRLEKYDLWMFFDNPEPSSNFIGYDGSHIAWEMNRDRCREVPGANYSDFTRNWRIEHSHGL